jgi:ATP-binding cassette subfamily C exporter for protease/lipase
MSPFVLYRILREFRHELVAIALYSGLINMLLIVPTLYMLQIFDRVMASKSEITLIILSAITLFLLMALAMAEWARAKIMLAVSNSLEEKYKRALFNSIFQRTEANITDAPTQVFIDVARVKQWMTSNSLYAFFDLPFSILYIVVMYALHPVLGYITVMSVLILAVIAFLSARNNAEISEEADKYERDMENFAYQKVQNAAIISVLGMIGNVKLTWLSKESHASEVQLKNQKLESKYASGSKEIRTLLQCLAIAISAMLVIMDQISFGAMVAAGLLMNRATSPVDLIVTGWKGLSGARQAFQRLRWSFLNSDDTGEKRVPTENLVRVQLEGLSYSTNDGGLNILEDISVSYAPSAIHVIVGESGAGKSTMGRIILGTIPPTSGKLAFNEVPMSMLSQEWRRNNFAYVPQEPCIFDGTVADNIARMGNPEPEQVIKAAQLVGIHESILKLPMGYNTLLDSTGAPLSGGQKQLLAIARAVYVVPRLIFLDEPNSNLDIHGQNMMTSVLNNLRNLGATIFIVTHRSQILTVADSITVLQKGRIVFNGLPDKDIVDQYIRLTK